MNLTIEPNGDIVTLGDLPEWIEGERATRRVSHVLPLQPAKRFWFRVLRRCFGERGRVAAWTRSWRGAWEGRIIGSERRFTHPSRQVVLRWERDVFES